MKNYQLSVTAWQWISTQYRFHLTSRSTSDGCSHVWYLRSPAGGTTVDYKYVTTLNPTCTEYNIWISSDTAKQHVRGKKCRDWPEVWSSSCLHGCSHRHCCSGCLSINFASGLAQQGILPPSRPLALPLKLSAMYCWTAIFSNNWCCWDYPIKVI